jgi:hypothetical protein
VPLGEHCLLLGAIHTEDTDMRLAGIEKGCLLSQESTGQLVLPNLWTPDQRLTGYAYGFWEFRFNGQHILYHPGDTLQFHSLLTGERRPQTFTPASRRVLVLFRDPANDGDDLEILLKNFPQKAWIYTPKVILG